MFGRLVDIIKIFKIQASSVAVAAAVGSVAVYKAAYEQPIITVPTEQAAIAAVAAAGAPSGVAPPSVSAIGTGLLASAEDVTAPEPSVADLDVRAEEPAPPSTMPAVRASGLSRSSASASSNRSVNRDSPTKRANDEPAATSFGGGQLRAPASEVIAETEVSSVVSAIRAAVSSSGVTRPTDISISGSLVITTATCTAYSIRLVDSGLTERVPVAETVVSVAATGAGAFYSDGGCTVANSTVAIGPTTSSAILYYSNNTEEVANFSAAAVGLTSTSQVVSVDGTPPVVALTSLTGGSTHQGSATTSITWTASDTTGLATNPIQLSYSSDSGATWVSIVAATSNSGSYSWTMPALNASTVRVLGLRAIISP